MQALAVCPNLIDMAGDATLFNPTTDPQLYRREARGAYGLPGRPGAVSGSDVRYQQFRPGQPVSAQETLAVSWGMVDGVKDINGFNLLQPRRYTDYLFGTETQDARTGYLFDEQSVSAREPDLELAQRQIPAGTGIQPPSWEQLPPDLRNPQGDRLRRRQGHRAGGSPSGRCSPSSARSRHARYMSPEQAEMGAWTSTPGATSTRWGSSSTNS